MKKWIAPLIMLLLGFLLGAFIWDKLSNEPGVPLFQTSESGTEQTLPDTPNLKEASVTQVYESRQNAITNAVSRVSSAVVGINVTQILDYRGRGYNDPFLDYFFPELRHREKVKGLGSGFIISPDGYVITNEHVVHNATEIIVTLPDKSHLKAEVVASDFISDVALLKIARKTAFPYIALGNSDDLIIGEWAIALGNPFGLFEYGAKPSVTIGIISAVDRDFGKVQDGKVYQDMIQTDASINGGNSGGPLVNSLGEVIGVNTFIYSGSSNATTSIGLGFAIPINRVKKIVRDLKQFGEVNRAFWTGLEVDDLNYLIARYLGKKDLEGVIVSNIEPNSPASRTNLEIGDVIVEVNGVKVRNTRSIQDVIDNLDVKGGDVLTLKIYRNRKFIKVKITLEQLPRK